MTTGLNIIWLTIVLLKLFIKKYFFPLFIIVWNILQIFFKLNHLESIINKSFDKKIQFDNFQFAIQIILVTVQTITVLLNIIIIIVMKRSQTTNESHRRNILMTAIAISGLIVIIDFFIPPFMLVPLLNQINHNISMILQSLVNYINALSLYVISFTMTAFCIDHYYSIVLVFDNPLGKASTSLLIKIIWLESSVLSIFFIITDDVYYCDYRTRSLVCSQYENYWTNAFWTLRTILIARLLI